MYLTAQSQRTPNTGAQSLKTPCQKIVIKGLGRSLDGAMLCTLIVTVNCNLAVCQDISKGAQSAEYSKNLECHNLLVSSLLELLHLLCRWLPRCVKLLSIDKENRSATCRSASSIDI